MATTEAQVAAAAVWLDQHAAAAEQIKDAAEQAARTTWLGFEAWYSAAAVAAVAAEMADTSLASQDVIVGAAQQFVANVVSVIKGGPTKIGRTPTPVIRNGAPLELVHTRPAETYRKAVATGSDHDEAVALAVARAETLVATDMSLAERASQQALMEELGITQFRRVVRPELSETGSCGLCIVASDRIYNTAVLMPIHPPSCNCKTMPIVGDADPGRDLNRADLAKFYADAGSNKAADLKRTRYQVNEHGEFGPVITKAGNSFRGPGQVALENDPDRAARMLAKALPVLERMEAGGTSDGPLDYQRTLVARLTSIVAA